MDGQCHRCDAECRNAWGVKESVEGRVEAARALADKIKSQSVETKVGAVEGADKLSVLALATMLGSVQVHIYHDQAVLSLCEDRCADMVAGRWLRHWCEPAL